jgi:hypothetical protein
MINIFTPSPHLLFFFSLPLSLSLSLRALIPSLSPVLSSQLPSDVFIFLTSSPFLGFSPILLSFISLFSLLRGIDVSRLFSEMIMASVTTDVVQKKLVYLYIVNYAESNKDISIMSINTLLKVRERK